VAKRGPKRDRYEAADRMYRLRALELVRAGESRWAASQAVVDDNMEGIGSDYAKAKRIHGWLLKQGDMPLVLIQLSEAGNVIADMVGKLNSKKIN
jgi:hypothetical protein